MSARDYRPFTGAEDRQILDRTLSDKATADRLGRPVRAVRNRRYALLNGTGRSRRSWTQEEDRQILAADRPSDAALVKILDRSIQAIQIRRSRIREGVGNG